MERTVTFMYRQKRKVGKWETRMMCQARNEKKIKTIVYTFAIEGVKSKKLVLERSTKLEPCRRKEEEESSR